MQASERELPWEIVAGHHGTRAANTPTSARGFSHIATQQYAVVCKRLACVDKPKRPTTEANKKNISSSSRRQRLNKSSETAPPYTCNQAGSECRYAIEINFWKPCDIQTQNGKTPKTKINKLNPWKTRYNSTLHSNQTPRQIPSQVDSTHSTIEITGSTKP